MWSKLFGNKADDIKRANRWLFGMLLAFGIVGLISSFTLSWERIHLLQDPDAQLTCSFNLVFNCAGVMETWQASLLGFPNPFIGMMAYPVVITLAIALLAGVRFPRWFMALGQVCFGVGLIFAYWLFFQSVYVIEILCPWCLFVTVATTLLFEALLRYNLRENNLYLNKQQHKRALHFLAKDYDKLIVAGWLLLMVVLVILQFGEGLVA